jgi:hypothetical protein
MRRSKLLNRLVIKPPPAGRTTVTLVTHRYLDRAEAAKQGCERGTKTVYLGSFPVDLEPRRLDGVERIPPGDTLSGVSVRPNVQLDGKPFELQLEDVQQIRSWLLEHGSWARHQADLASYREKLAQQRAADRALLEAQIRAELRETLRGEVMDEVRQELDAQRGHPIEDAVRAVQAAGQAVHEEATKLKADGHRMVTRRGPRARVEEAPVHQLLQLTLALRKQAFAQFEDPCKAAGLMGHKPAPKRAKGPAGR